MAAIVSKAEIDALLSQIKADEIENEKQAEQQANPIDPSKVVRVLPPPDPRLRITYKSPVIKADRVAFNPDPATTPPPRKVVVRTLRNYHHYLKLLHNPN